MDSPTRRAATPEPLNLTILEEAMLDVPACGFRIHGDEHHVHVSDAGLVADGYLARLLVIGPTPEALGLTDDDEWRLAIQWWSRDSSGRRRETILAAFRAALAVDPREDGTR